jgi:ParB-like chromosome segregation protein Spo0J
MVAALHCLEKLLKGKIMQIRDRIKEFRRVRASSLRPNPRNWRTHPQAQRDALQGILAEVGYAGALLARTLPDGSLELIDGHLRAETTPDQEVPVLVLDLDETEAAKLLALFDPLSGMAETDEKALADLLAEVETENDAVRTMLDNLLAEPTTPELEELPDEPPEVEIPEAYQVVVHCRDESQQQEVYERLTADGFKCKLMTL